MIHARVHKVAFLGVATVHGNVKIVAGKIYQNILKAQSSTARPVLVSGNALSAIRPTDKTMAFDA